MSKNVRYNNDQGALNAVGTQSLGGSTMDAEKFPRIITIQDTMPGWPINYKDIDIAAYNFTAMPLAFVTSTYLTPMNALLYFAIDPAYSSATTLRVAYNPSAGYTPPATPSVTFNLFIIGY